MPRDAVLVDGAVKVLLMHQDVVSLAEESGIVQVRTPAAAPPAEVMDVAPGGRSRAGGVGAVAISAGDGAALGSGEIAFAVPEVEEFAVSAEDHRDELGVAGQSANRPRRQEVSGAGEAGAADLLVKVGQRDRDDDLGFGAAG